WSGPAGCPSASRWSSCRRSWRLRWPPRPRPRRPGSRRPASASGAGDARARRARAPRPDAVLWLLPFAWFVRPWLAVLCRGPLECQRVSERCHLAQNPPEEEDSDDEGCGTTAERNQGGQKSEADLLWAHQPFAWSRMRASNGFPPGGVTWKARAHRPTM